MGRGILFFLGTSRGCIARRLGYIRRCQRTDGSRGECPDMVVVVDEEVGSARCGGGLALKKREKEREAQGERAPAM